MALGKFVVFAAIAATLSLMPHAFASAATYTGNYLVDPLSLSCGYFSSVEICSKLLPINAPLTLNVGDQVDENISYTSPVSVPGSNSQNLLFVVLPDAKDTNGPVLSGPQSATVSSKLYGYESSSSLPPISTPSFNTSSLNAYLAIAGFCCSYGEPSPSFSATGIDANFQINTADVNPIYQVSVGYTYDLPYTPQTILGFDGGMVGSPVILPSGYVGESTSNISGSASDSQFYTFHWDGGLFQTTGSITGANPLADFQFQLFAVNGTEPIEGVTVPIESLELSTSLGYSALLSKNLAAGNYEIGLYTDSPYDPQFTIKFDTPVTSAAPEPSTWALLAAALAMTGGMLRVATARRNEKEIAGIAAA